MFESEIEAAETFDTFVVQNGSYHKLNFPEKIDEYKLRNKIESKKKKGTSKYYGVYLKGDSYIAQAKQNGQIWRKICQTEHYAALQYDKIVVSNRLNKPLNFPDSHKDYVPLRKIRTEVIFADDHTTQIEIKSRPGLVAFIDTEDYDSIKHHTCCVDQDGYIVIVIDAQNYRLSRFLMKESDSSVIIDHINGDRTDNRKENLRTSDTSRNARNRSKQANTSSKFIGVSKQSVNVWQIKVKRVRLGSERDEERAARKRDIYILTHFPHDHFKMNFDWTDNEIEHWKKEFNI